MNKVFFACVVILIAGCSSTPQLAKQPIEVKQDALLQYWEVATQSFSFNSRKSSKNFPDGYVIVRFLIDSEGKVFEPEIVESVPHGVWDSHGLKAVKKMQYSPSDTNSSRTPVFTTMKVEFLGGQFSS